MAQTILLIAEGPSDHQTVTCLADRLLLEKCDEEQAREEGLVSPWLTQIRRWEGIQPGTSFTAWRDIKDLAAQHRVRVLGGKAERSLDKDKLRKALILAEKLRHKSSRHMVVSRDLDTDHPEARRKSLEEVRDEYQSKGWTMVLAMALPFREAWVLNAYSPNNRAEQQALKAEQAPLGFDPTKFPERLDAQNPTAKNNAKRVLASLCQASHDPKEKELECLESCSLDELQKHGTGSGVAEFLQEVKQVIIPLLLGEED